MYRLTASLLNSWLRGTDPEAIENEYADFLSYLGREARPQSPAAKAGERFEIMVEAAARGEKPDCEDRDAQAIMQFGQIVRGGAYQVKAEKNAKIMGMDIHLVGIAVFLRAGTIFDIKRVQRYEYGKYQHSAQHPMYMELFPEALKFRYLIFDGGYCYGETYRRGDFAPIHDTAVQFLRYLDGAGLIDLYQSKWKEKA